MGCPPADADPTWRERCGSTAECKRRRGALLWVAEPYNVPTVCNRATADLLVASPLIHVEYERLLDERRR
jgi:hypothetical protein